MFSHTVTNLAKTLPHLSPYLLISQKLTHASATLARILEPAVGLPMPVRSTSAPAQLATEEPTVKCVSTGFSEVGKTDYN